MGVGFLTMGKTMEVYRFNACSSNNTSPIGRTKTIPKKGSKVSEPIRLAVYSCSNYRKYRSYDDCMVDFNAKEESDRMGC